MRWTREQYLDLMTFKPVERPMFCELFGPLVGLPEEWRAQGASDEEIDLTAFDWDYVDKAPVGGRVQPISGIEPEVLEETPTRLLKRDYLGRVVELDKRTATIPLPQTHPVEDMDDWQKIKHWFAWDESRISPEQIELAKQRKAEGALITAGVLGGYDMPRQLMGEELACVAYYEEPEMMHDMLETFADTAERVLERIGQHIQIDQLSIHEDFAGKSGPLVGPPQMDAFLSPYYKRCWEAAKAIGAQIYQIDSDGDINPILDQLSAGGINSLLPVEPVGGMDPVAIRRAYGQRFRLVGGIDKHVLREGEDAIVAELEYKLQPMMQRSGGIVFGLDHRIPNGTPLEAYRFYVRTAREMLGLPSLEATASRGWARMAF